MKNQLALAVLTLVSACHNLTPQSTLPATNKTAASSADNVTTAAPLNDARHTPEPAHQQPSFFPIQKKSHGQKFVAVTANPLATQAAFNVLAKGGTAVDAAIAAQWVLGLVEPQSSGLGGGGFMLYWNAATHQLHSYDGRETAPMNADETLFIDAASLQPMSFINAIVGGRSVGVPGLVSMLDIAHRDYGSQPWGELTQPAIALARQGFTVSPRLHYMVERVPALDVRQALKQYLFPNGSALVTGDQLKNSEYAMTLERIAVDRADAFYRSDITVSMVDAVNQDSNAGGLSLADFSNYRALQRSPVCKTVFAYSVCGMAPPSSGGSTVIAILLLLEEYLKSDLGESAAGCSSINDCAPLAHAFIEASRIAFADRNAYIADPDFVAVPIDKLLDKKYLSTRAALISAVRNKKYLAGVPVGIEVGKYLSIESAELASTTHMSIVDSYGNMVSMTTSIETAFGSRVMTRGFILNNQLTDFSFAPVDGQRRKVANRAQGGKRPTSSMSPTIVFDSEGEPVLVIGSPGGKSIIGFVARVIYEVLVMNKALDDSMAAPHIIDTGNKLRLDTHASAQLVEQLKIFGHDPHLMPLTSGIHAIMRKPAIDGEKGIKIWEGVADPRREGTALAR